MPVRGLVDRVSAALVKLAVEIDGSRHFDDKNAYRRDRRKDELLQGEGYFVLRFLAEDVMSDLGNVIDRIVRHLPKKMT